MRSFTNMKLLLLVLFFVIYFNGKVFGKSDNVKQTKEYNKQLKTLNNKLKTLNEKLKTVNDKLKNKKAKAIYNISQANPMRKQSKLSQQLVSAKQNCWNLDNRYLNRTSPQRSSLPWMVAIFKWRKQYKRYVFSCGGSLISRRFVLTAAHCFLNKYRRWSIKSYSELRVRYGTHDLSSGSFSESGVVKVFPHPRFMTTTGYHSDLALVKLTKGVAYNDRVSPICVPYLTTPITWNRSRKGRRVQVSGWGKKGPPISRPGPKAKLDFQTGHALILNRRVCQNYFSGRHNPFTTLCIGKTSTRSAACKGDSGSPVNPISFKRTGECVVYPVVIGIVSFGQRWCGGPSISTKVNCFIGWINEVTRK